MSSNRRNYLTYDASCTIGDLNPQGSELLSESLTFRVRVHESDNVEFAVPSEILCLLILSKIPYKVKSFYISAYPIAILYEGFVSHAIILHIVEQFRGIGILR